MNSRKLYITCIYLYVLRGKQYDNPCINMEGFTKPNMYKIQFLQNNVAGKRCKILLYTEKSSMCL